MTISDRIRITSIRPLSNGHFKLNAVTFDWRRDDGQWQSQQREVLDRGDAAALLPYNLGKRTVVLVKQFRYPAYANGHDDLLVEVAAGLLDSASPEQRIRAEAEEETGYRLHDVQKIFEA
jgi:nudix-type nucleoside diphosphatase (YffH/AdpP family)